MNKYEEMVVPVVDRAIELLQEGWCQFNLAEDRDGAPISDDNAGHTIMLIFAILIPSILFAEVEIWNYLAVKPENRCSEYKRSDYRYPQSVEDELIILMGGYIYSHYENRLFVSKDETHIEHIVALSEAHDSGLCNQSKEIRKYFAQDILNLTLSSPSVNFSKGGKDAGEWSPANHRKWFAGKVIRVKLKYFLSIDHTERDSLNAILKEN